MKLAWLCYRDDEDDPDGSQPEIYFSEPDRWPFKRIVPIVYAVLEE